MVAVQVQDDLRRVLDDDGKIIKSRIVDQVFYDKEGEQQNV